MPAPIVTWPGYSEQLIRSDSTWAVMDPVCKGAYRCSFEKSVFLICTIPETWFSLINMPPSHLEHVWIAWSPAYHFPNGPTSQGREFRGFGGRVSRGPGAQGPCLLILAWRRSKNVVLRNVLKHVWKQLTDRLTQLWTKSMLFTPGTLPAMKIGPWYRYG